MQFRESALIFEFQLLSPVATRKTCLNQSLDFFPLESFYHLKSLGNIIGFLKIIQ